MSNVKIAQACNHLGLGLFGLGLNQDANLAFRQAIAVDASFADSYHNLANVLYAEGKISSAIHYYEEAIRRQPRPWSACLDLGKALTRLAQFDKAIMAFQQALAIEPTCVAAAIALSTAYRLKGDLDQALVAAEAAIAMPNRTEECYFVLGLTQQARGSLDFAIGAYQYAVMIKADFDKAHKQLHNLVANIQARRNSAMAPTASSAWSQSFASLFDEERKPEFAIMCFHNIGDILLCTPVARQLKNDYPDCNVVWYTSESYAFALKNNPYVDEVVALPGESPQAMYDMYETRLRNERAWTRFISPAPYRNYEKVPHGNLLDLVRAGADMEMTVPMAPVVRLTSLEEATAKRYWDQLPEGLKILVECEFKSGQTLWDYSDTLALIDALKEFNPVFVFTSKKKPAFLVDLIKRYPNVVWCGEPFRQNAYFFNNADALISVSSGITALIRSEYCRRDIPVIEFSKGEHWSSAIHEDADNLQVAFSRPRFRDSLARLVAHFRGQTMKPDFTPRFPTVSCPDTAVERDLFACPSCGSTWSKPIRAGIVVQCDDCRLSYLRERPKGAVVATGHPGLQVPSAGESRARTRFPPSIDAIDAVEEFIHLQRREEFTRLEAIYGQSPADKTFIGIGCGWGARLHYARQRKMKPIGFYATRRDRDYAVNRLDLDVRDVSFMETDIPAGSIDIIIIDGALNEAAHPFEFMQKVGYVMAPGGVCQVTVPNLESMFSIVQQELWWGFSPSRQSVYFTPPTLRDLLSQAGFHIKSCETLTGPPTFDQAIATMRRWWPDKSLEDCTNALAQFDRSGAGDSIRIVGVKRAAPHYRLKDGPAITAGRVPAPVRVAPVRHFFNGGSIGEMELVAMLEALDWQGIRQVNILDSSILSRLLALGWHDLAKGELWSSERTASIGLKIVNASPMVKDFVVTLDMKGPPASGADLPECQPVEILVNGTSMKQPDLPRDTWTSLRIIVPGHQVGPQGELVVKIVNGSMVPDAVNHRKNGVGLKSMTIDPSSTLYSVSTRGGEETNLIDPEIFGHLDLDGFHGVEDWHTTSGIWSASSKARLSLALDRRSDVDLELKVRACIQDGLPDIMQVDVLANGHKLGHWAIDSADNLQDFSMILPRSILDSQQVLVLEFHSNQVLSPADLGISPDIRKLGVGFVKVALAERLESDPVDAT